MSGQVLSLWKKDVTNVNVTGSMWSFGIEGFAKADQIKAEVKGLSVYQIRKWVYTSDFMAIVKRPAMNKFINIHLKIKMTQ